MRDAQPSTATRVRRAAPALVGAVAAAWLSLAVAAPVEAPPGAIVVVAPSLASPWLVGAALLLLAVAASGRAAALLPLASVLSPVLLAGVPAAWVYAGPGVALVWATVAALAWRATWPAPRAPKLRESPWLPAVLGAIWLGVAAAAVNGVAMRGDAPHYLTIAHSLVTDGDLDLRNDYDTRSYRAFYAGQLEPRHTAPAPTGEEYSFHGVGVSFLVAPAYWMFGALGATATLVVLLAIGSGLLWSAARRLTADTGAAWFSWAALVTCAPFTLHAAAIYPDGPAAVGVAAALWLIVRLDDATPVPLSTLALASVGLAGLPWLHVRLALPAAVFGVAVLVGIARSQPDRWTRALWFLVVPAISCAGWLASTYVMFGTWNPTSTMLQRTAPGAWSALPAGVFGMLMDQEFGLWPIAPVFVAAPFALRRLGRTSPVLAVSTAVAAGGVLLTSSLWVWWGGDSAPARFLTVVLPVLALWLAALWVHASQGGKRALGLGLAWSGALTLLLVFVDGGGHAYNYPDGASTIFGAFSSVVDVGSALPSMFRAGATLGSELPLAVIWAVVLVPALWLVAAQSGKAPWRTGAAGLALVAATGVAAGVAWRARGVTAWTPGIAQQRVLARLASDGVAAVALSPWRGRVEGDPHGLLRLRSLESVPRDSDVRLYVPNVPAGRYALHVTPGASSDTGLRLDLGRDAETYRRWRAATASPVLTLARTIHSVRVLGPPDAASDVWLVPLSVTRTAGGQVARRVTRVGDLDVYSMDDDTHVDDGSLWTGGDRSTSVVVAAESTREVTVGFQAGPSPVSVDVDAGILRRSVDIEADGTASLGLGTTTPTDPLEVHVTIRGGFPASQLRAGDRRTLGVRMTFGDADGRAPASRR